MVRKQGHARTVVILKWWQESRVRRGNYILVLPDQNREDIKDAISKVAEATESS